MRGGRSSGIRRAQPKLEPSLLPKSSQKSLTDRKPSIKKPELLRAASKVILLALVYYAAARLSLLAALVDRNVTPVWPPTGIALVALFTLGRNIWPGIALGAFLVNLPISPSPGAAAIIAAGNTLAPLVAADLLRRVGFRVAIDRLKDVMALVFLGALAAMMVSATTGATTLVLSRAVPASEFVSAWAVWWTGDAMGVLIVTPLLFALRTVRPSGRVSWRWAEAILLFTGLVVAARVSLWTDVHPLYLVFPFLTWAAIRFQHRGAAPAAAVVSAMAIWAAIGSVGPFAEGTLFRKMVLLQAFNGTVSLTTLVLAATKRSLSRTQVLYHIVLENVQDLISLVDLEGRYVYVSRSHEQVLGYAPEELIGRSGLVLIHPDDIQRMEEALAQSTSQDAALVSEVRMRHRKGQWVILEGLTKVVADEEGRPQMILVSGRDISERRRAELQIAFLAFHDKLTGLANRAKFEELMEMAVARARRHSLAVAVLYMDLDNFKLVNDSLGHAAGDDLLREVAARLIQLTRETDVVGRLGGDEFLLLLPDLHRSLDAASQETTDSAVLQAEAVAARVHEALREPFVLSDTEFYVTTSMGISLYPLDAEDGRSLLKNADAAMYQSKKAGPGGYMLFPTSADDPRSALSLATRVRKAVENEHWVLHYQPIVDLEQGQPVGVEALLRWQVPGGGLVLPGEFLALAEEMGFIGRIGEWVMQELFRQTRTWLEAGVDLYVSFNLSPRQLWHPELTERLLESLGDSPVDPSRLVVEITESAAMADIDRTQQILSTLRERGFRFAIDDFGTGYSSLSRLRDLPVDILKIDRSFVRDVPESPDARTVVQAIIQLARSLGMSPLAEGIETAEQWRFLVDHGCPFGQGFYFHRPAPAGEVALLFQRTGFPPGTRQAG
jgi:diguanylate cyclase (GGDEF)-like protein/PAS domain S-box-containing protein